MSINFKEQALKEMKALRDRLDAAIAEGEKDECTVDKLEEIFEEKISLCDVECVFEDVVVLQEDIREIMMERDDAQAIKKLIDQGPLDVNEPFCWGSTMLWEALFRHRPQTVKMLLDFPHLKLHLISIFTAFENRKEDYIRDHGIIEKIMKHPSFDIHAQEFWGDGDRFIWQRFDLSQEVLDVLKKHQKKQFKKSATKKLYDKIMPGEVECEGKKIDLSWPPGMVEMNLAPFLLPKIPDKVG